MREAKNVSIVWNRIEAASSYMLVALYAIFVSTFCFLQYLSLYTPRTIGQLNARKIVAALIGVVILVSLSCIVKSVHKDEKYTKEVMKRLPLSNVGENTTDEWVKDKMFTDLLAKRSAMKYAICLFGPAVIFPLNVLPKAISIMISGKTSILMWAMLAIIFVLLTYTILMGVNMRKEGMSFLNWSDEKKAQYFEAKRNFEQRPGLQDC